MEKGISLNKFISQTGFCSRRAADTIIEQGRVEINGAVAQKGNRVITGDVVTIDGEALMQTKKKIYIALNKPKGVETTANPNVANNIIDFIGHENRIFPVGRLDKNSEGLILLTNDGDFANMLIHARYQHEKEYIVSVDRGINKDFVKKMSSGVQILDRVTLPCEVEKINKNTFRIILKQGLNRQIRRMCNELGCKVTSLQRVRVVNIHLGKLALGKWRNLTSQEVDQLKSEMKKIELPPKARAPRIKKTRPRQGQSGTSRKTFKPKRRK